MKPASSQPGQPRGGVPQDVGAAVFLIGLAAIGLWQGAALRAGTLRQIGPGMLPRALSIATLIAGLMVLVRVRFAPGPRLERWKIRAPILILGAAVLFGLTVRPLGLLIAAPVAAVLSSLASPETRWRESLLFALGLTLFCTGLFKLLLHLPIPVAPFLIGY